MVNFVKFDLEWLYLNFFRIVEVRQRMNGKQRLTVSQTTNINIKKFAKYHAHLQNTPQILRIEFNELNEISSKFNMSDNVGKRYDNYRKNRYLNIIPCKLRGYTYYNQCNSKFTNYQYWINPLKNIFNESCNLIKKFQ